MQSHIAPLPDYVSRNSCTTNPPWNSTSVLISSQHKHDPSTTGPENRNQNKRKSRPCRQTLRQTERTICQFSALSTGPTQRSSLHDRQISQFRDVRPCKPFFRRARARGPNPPGGYIKIFLGKKSAETILVASGGKLTVCLLDRCGHVRSWAPVGGGNRLGKGRSREVFPAI